MPNCLLFYKALMTTKKVSKPITKKNTGQTLDESVRGGRFPIIGMGASAGVLEAFGQFFSHMPKDAGIAFVLIQHLDPNHESILDQILQRTTSIPVHEAQDQMQVLPNNIYVIPPNRDMAIFNGKLQVTMPAEPRRHYRQMKCPKH